MHNILYQKLVELLRGINSQYYRLIVLINNNQNKNIIIKKLQQDFSIQVINVSNELSKHLLELSPKQRIVRVDEIFNKIIESYISSSSDIIILDNIEILFDVALHQNPLKLLENMARKVNIVAIWNGKYIENKLYYGDMRHPESRSYEAQDIAIVQL